MNTSTADGLLSSWAPGAGAGAAGGHLAAAFQEPLTAIARLRGGRTTPPDPVTFRDHIRSSLALGADAARASGYPNEFIESAVYAIVGLLDAAVFDHAGPLRDSWTGSPLEEEIFGQHIAGERFFANIHDLLQRQDSPYVGDILEVYLICLYLGFQGRYSSSTGTELTGFATAVDERIRRIRGNRPELSVHALPPPDDLDTAREHDIVGRGMAIALVTGALGLILVTIALRMLWLAPGVEAIQQLGR